MSITSGRTHNLTCSVQDARPPAELEWHYPEEVQVRLEDQYNGVYGDAYTSRRVVSVTPSRDDVGKVFRCVASHRELDNGLQLFIHLDVQGDYLTNNIIPWLLGVRARACVCVCLSVCMFCSSEYVSKFEDCLKLIKHSASSKTPFTLLYVYILVGNHNIVTRSHDAFTA